MSEKRITFACGDIHLEGLLHVPPSTKHGKPRAAVVVCHPHPLYGGQMRNNVVDALVAAFIGAGMATLRFNFRGTGGSGGSHAGGVGELDDVRSAVEALLARCEGASPLAVAGYSFGAAVGLRAGADDPRVHALVGVAPPLAMMDCSFLTGYHGPKLLVTGDGDEFAPLASFESLFESLPEPRSKLVVNGADHFFAGCEHEVAVHAAAFLRLEED